MMREDRSDEDVDQRIAWVALDHIRKSSMKVESWGATTLGSTLLNPRLPVELEAGEISIVTGLFSNGDWYLWTTRNLWISFSGKVDVVRSDEISKGDFGAFKALPPTVRSGVPSENCNVAKIWSRSGRMFSMTYETGYASMAPIHCLDFWLRKRPILQRFMTPPEIDAYRRARGGN